MKTDNNRNQLKIKAIVAGMEFDVKSDALSGLIFYAGKWRRILLEEDKIQYFIFKENKRYLDKFCSI